MARVREQQLTPADELRGVLSDTEHALGKLRGSAADAVAILHGLDRIVDLMPGIEAKGLDLRPERTRLTSLQERLRRRARELDREVRSSGGWTWARQAARSSGDDRYPDRDRWWWYLDEELRSRRVHRIRRWLLRVVLVAILAGLGTMAYRRYLAPDPTAARVFQLRTRAEELARDGDYEGALALFEEAQAERPHDSELHAWRGVLLEVLGRSAQADQAFRLAAAQFPEANDFHALRGQVYLLLGQFESADLDAELILRSDPDSPKGLFLQAMVYEGEGDLQRAIASYELASEAADQRDEAELTALARVRMALLMQRGISLEADQ